MKTHTSEPNYIWLIWEGRLLWNHKQIEFPYLDRHIHIQYWDFFLCFFFLFSLFFSCFVRSRFQNCREVYIHVFGGFLFFMNDSTFRVNRNNAFHFTFFAWPRLVKMLSKFSYVTFFCYSMRLYGFDATSSRMIVHYIGSFYLPIGTSVFVFGYQTF